MYKTFQFRLKSNNVAELNRMARSVNFVWNYCNDTAMQYLDKKGIWVSGYQLESLTKGCAADLHLNSQTVKEIASRYVTHRIAAKRRRLAWRSRKSLGWVPFKGVSVAVNEDRIRYKKIIFRFWKSRKIEGDVKIGSFSQDSRGRWYVNLTCEVSKPATIKSGGAVGIDLGLKTIATLSNGVKLDRENLTRKYADRLATAQRARKPRQVKAIHAKIQNTRKDWNHKQTTKLINQYDKIIVGNVSPSKLKGTRMAKSVSDASWADFKSMLSYKAIALGVEFSEVNESYSSVTCSGCFERSGPSGLSALGVREWTCSCCGELHDRDTNAAKNILRIGHDTPIKGTLGMPTVSEPSELKQKNYGK